MALQNIEIAAFSSVYVGDADTSAVLTYLTSLRTGGSTLTYEIPEQYIESQTNSVQNDYTNITLTLQFLSDDDSISRLAQGNLPTSGSPDDPSTFKMLSILLVHPDGANGNHSIYIPRCYAIKRFQLNYEKTRPTTIPITFKFFQRSRFMALYYKRTNSALISVMGSKSPL